MQGEIKQWFSIVRLGITAPANSAKN
jgi:hypothetical protein